VKAPEELSRAAGQTIPVVHKPLVVPTRIPTHVSQVIDNLSQIAAPAAAISAAYADGVANGVLGAVLDVAGRTPPPSTAAARTEPRKETAPVQRIVVGGNVQKAMLVHSVTPQYPPLARSARISGKVVLSAIIGTDGRVQSLKTVTGHPLLLDA